MSSSCTPIVVGVTSPVSEILLLSKTTKFPFLGMDYSPWSSKNLIFRNRLKKFMRDIAFQNDSINILITGNCIRKLPNKLKTPLKQQSNHCNETKYQDTTTTATTLSILLKRTLQIHFLLLEEVS